MLNPDGCGFRSALQRALASLAMPLRLRLDIFGRELQLQSVAQGLGLGLVPQSLLECSGWRADLEPVSVSDFGPLIDLWLVHSDKPGRLLVPIARMGECVLAASRGQQAGPLLPQTAQTAQVADKLGTSRR